MIKADTHQMNIWKKDLGDIKRKLTQELTSSDRFIFEQRAKSLANLIEKQNNLASI